MSSEASFFAATLTPFCNTVTPPSPDFQILRHPCIMQYQPKFLLSVGQSQLYFWPILSTDILKLFIFFFFLIFVHCPLSLFEKHKHFHRTNFGPRNKKLNINQTEFMHQMIFDWSVKVEQEMTLFISGIFSVVSKY